MLERVGKLLPDVVVVACTFGPDHLKQEAAVGLSHAGREGFLQDTKVRSLGIVFVLEHPAVLVAGGRWCRLAEDEFPLDDAGGALENETSVAVAFCADFATFARAGEAACCWAGIAHIIMRVGLRTTRSTRLFLADALARLLEDEVTRFVAL